MRPILAAVLLVTACAHGASHTAMPETPAAEAEHDPEVVVEAWMTVGVEDLGAAARAVRAEVRARGGRVVDDELGAVAQSGGRGTLRVRVPPRELDAFLDAVATQGEVDSRRIKATDVSREFFDRSLALKNLNATRLRLEALMARGEKLSDVMEVDRELARVRGEIEKLEGAERWQRDAVTWATVEIALVARGAAGLGMRPKLMFGPRATTLALVGGPTLAGGGATFLFERSFSMDVDVFEQRAVLATIGGAAYSDLLGGGRRHFANPYLGWRVGYGYLDQRSRFVISAELGLELVKTKYVALDASARAVGLVGSVTDGGVQGQVGLLVAF